MYQGKHLKKNMRKRRRNRQKATMLLTSLVLVLTLLVGGTVAFLIATDGSAKNVFRDSTVSCQIHENSFDGTTKSGVTIENTGDTEAYIRAAIVVTWKDAENGNVYGKKPIAGTDYVISYGTDWFLGGDGFYYYKNPVAAGDSTTNLINTCSPVDASTPAGYGLNVEILGSAIQSVPVNAIVEQWGVTVNDNGTLSE